MIWREFYLQYSAPRANHDLCNGLRPTGSIAPDVAVTFSCVVRLNHLSPDRTEIGMVV